MHIPDGFLDVKTAVASATLAAVGVGVAVKRARQTLPSSRLPILGLSAAFIFAAQMVNFPVAAGTSGHLIGAVLATVLLGPSGAVIVLTSVLLVQALLFADGGVLALGANILNMAVIAPLCGSAVLWVFERYPHGERWRLAAIGLAAWISVVAASLFCAGELAWAELVPWNVAVMAMTGIHMLIGVGEAVITMVVISALTRMRGDLVRTISPAPGSRVAVIAYGVLLVAAVVLFVAPFASPWPDGLERVASGLGFSSRAVSTPVLPTWLADYRLAGINSPALATGIAGLVGAAVVFALSWAVAAVLVPHSGSTTRPGGTNDAPPGH